MAIIITGYSHCFCMGINPSGELRLEPIRSETSEVYGVMGGWNGSRDDIYWEFVAKHAKGKSIIISWAGNQHNSGFIFSNEESFDFVLNNHDFSDLADDKTILPKSVLIEHFKPSLGGLPKVIEILKKGMPREILILETPRPKGDGEFIIPFIKSSQHFTDLANKSNIDIESLEISSLRFRLKLWQLIQEMVAKIAKASNVKYVPIPSDFYDKNGGVKREYWANDVTHTNSDYGNKIIKYLGSIVSPAGGAK